MQKDRNDFAFPNTPCMVIVINHCKKSNAIRYRLCLPDAVIIEQVVISFKLTRIKIISLDLFLIFI
jgi:hypothetical protein